MSLSQDKQINAIIKAAFKSADKRVEACKRTPLCDKCDSNQIQLVDWIERVEWKCRHCGHRMYENMS